MHGLRMDSASPPAPPPPPQLEVLRTTAGNPCLLGPDLWTLKN